MQAGAGVEMLPGMMFSTPEFLCTTSSSRGTGLPFICC